MKPIFCGNFEYDARQSDLERLFRRYGRVDRVDMKSGFAFIYMEDERDGEDAIRGLDQIEFGRKGRRIRVEWTKQERGVRRTSGSGGGGGSRSGGGGSKRSASRPSKTLFVINFDPYRTRTRDLERHFDPYGRIANVRIRRNFGFVQFETQEDATKALESTHMSTLMDRVISVEYAIRDDDERRNGHSPPDRIRERSPGRRGGYERVGGSTSPYQRRERGSPDYGHAPPNLSPRRVGRRGSPSSPSPYRRDRGGSKIPALSRSPPPSRRRSNASPPPPRFPPPPPSRHRRDTPSPHEDHALSPSPKRGGGLSPCRIVDSLNSPLRPRRDDDDDDAAFSPSPSPSPPRAGRNNAPSPARGDDDALNPASPLKPAPGLEDDSPAEDGRIEDSPSGVRAKDGDESPFAPRDLSRSPETREPSGSG